MHVNWSVLVDGVLDFCLLSGSKFYHKQFITYLKLIESTNNVLNVEVIARL